MQIGAEGLALIKHFEGCVLSAYPDPASQLAQACRSHGLPLSEFRMVVGWHEMRGDPWTIGWGHTGREVRPGVVWSQLQADAALALDLHSFECDVSILVRVSILQCEFDALCSFAFNVGSDIDDDHVAEGLGDSTLLRLLNAGDHAGAAAQFEKWVKAQGKTLPGLVARRKAERALFEGRSWR